MKGLGILLMAALLSLAPGYGSAQQAEEKNLMPPPNKPVEEYKFPENPKPEEYKFPEKPEKMGEFKFPEKRAAEKATSPATQPMGQKGKGEQAEPAKNLSPKEKEYLKNTAADLAGIQKKIDALKVRKEFRIVQRKRANMMIMVDLQKRALNARKQLAALEKAPDTAWGGLRTEMDQTMGDLNKTYSDALQFFE
jgi:hypothetical protein